MLTCFIVSLNRPRVERYILVTTMGRNPVVESGYRAVP